jgi:uncharacterized protein (UPF0305 family)
MFFKKKPEDTEKKREIILTEYITELRKLGFSNRQIKNKFIEKKYPSEFVDYLLQLNRKEVKPMTEEEYDEDFEEEQEEEDEEPEPTPKQVKKFKKPALPIEKQEVTLEKVFNALQVLANETEKRLRAIEASLYRIRNA